jgi:hypothetical protein
MRKLAMIAVTLAACATTGVNTVSPPSDVAVDEAANPPPSFGAGSRMMVQLTQPLGAGISYAGERFSATVAEPVLGTDGEVLIPAGAQVAGRVAEVRSSQGAESTATLVLAVDELQSNALTFPLRARIIGVDPQAAQHGLSWKMMVGSFDGGVLGSIVGQQKSTVAGPFTGRAGGTLISLGRDPAQQLLPAGTALAIELEQSIPELE